MPPRPRIYNPHHADILDGGPVSRMRSNVAPKRFGAGAAKPEPWVCRCGQQHREYVVKCACGTYRPDRRPAA
jgi:hypothetical protein